MDANQTDKVIEGLLGAIYVLHAEHAALLKLTQKIAAEVSPDRLPFDVTSKFYVQQKLTELERMVLKIGDSRPDVAESLQKAIDDARKPSGGPK